MKEWCDDLDLDLKVIVAVKLIKLTISLSECYVLYQIQKFLQNVNFPNEMKSCYDPFKNKNKNLFMNAGDKNSTPLLVITSEI